MRTYSFVLTLAIWLPSLIAHGQNPGPNADGVKWQQGPSIANLASVAVLRIPSGYVFAGANDTRVLMEAMQNPVEGNEIGFFAPAGREWFILFQFDESGYVRDDEKSSLDADAMLETIKKATEVSNKERRRRGWPVVTVLGWEQKPRYDDSTHNLEWATRITSEGNPAINFNTRLLGRGGVMSVTLVADPSTLSTTLPRFRTVLTGFDFSQGQRYAEYRQGDKLAKYGLSALIVGGATAVAVKTGMFKWLWKVILVAIVAGAASIKKLFARK